MTNIGYATLDVIPSMRGFHSALSRGTQPALASAGADAGKRFSSSFTRALRFGAVGGGIGAAFGIASFVKDSVELEAKYSKTMAQMRVATKAPADELQRLDDLAIRLGKETVFSAVEASDAMLELAKNGITPATIEAGALKSALTLAAAGGTDLTDSATAMGNTLNAFRLKGKRAASVAAALAGAANASSASVGSLAEGLQQASTVAADVGFNVQETTGVLAAFANAGIAGSDAGTSLKTMLSRLQPATAKAKDYMDRYGLSFVKANGEFKTALEVAGELKDGLGELSASERSQALNTIFGSDARRAATILTKEGTDGLREYIKATSDQGAAEEMAQANMEGTAGAIERLKGSWETTKLEFGKSIAPVAANFLDYLSTRVDDVAPKLVDFGEWFTEDGVPKIQQFAGFMRDDVLPVMQDVGDFASDAAGFIGDLGRAFDKLPKEAQLAGLAALLGGGAALKVRGGGGGALGTLGKAVGLAKPIPVFVTNQGFGAGADVTPDGKPKPGKSGLVKGVGKALTAAVLADVAYEATAGDLYGMDTTPNQKRQTVSPFGVGLAAPTGGVFDKEVEKKFDVLTSKAGVFSDELDLIGAKKINPSLTVPGLKPARKDLQDFLALQVEAGKPITPYVALNGYDRVMAQINTLRANIHTLPGAGTGEGGAPFISGGARAGITIDQRGSTIVAHDYNDFVKQTGRKAQQAGLGGRPNP